VKVPIQESREESSFYSNSTVKRDRRLVDVEPVKQPREPLQTSNKSDSISELQRLLGQSLDSISL
jgi:hypothetical protein